MRYINLHLHYITLHLHSFTYKLHRTCLRCMRPSFCVCVIVCLRMIQEYLLHNAMSIFTFVGNSLAQHDDAYSFQLITRTIDTVIPALITVSMSFMLMLVVVVVFIDRNIISEQRELHHLIFLNRD